MRQVDSQFSFENIYFSGAHCSPDRLEATGVSPRKLHSDLLSSASKVDASVADVTVIADVPD